MPSINGFEYPENNIDNLIRALKIFKDRLKGETNSADALAASLGHRSGRSGAFLRKIADLRKYGLITERGMKITDLGEKIAKPFNQTEFNESLKQTIFKINLWKKIYEKIGNRPITKDFWIIVHEVTGADRGLAEQEAGKIGKLYSNAISKIKAETFSMPIRTDTDSTTMVSEIIEFKSNDFSFSGKKTKTNIKWLIDSLGDMLKSIEKNKKKKQKTLKT